MEMSVNQRLSLRYTGMGNAGTFSLTRLDPALDNDNLYDLATAIDGLVDRGEVAVDYQVVERFLLI